MFITKLHNLLTPDQLAKLHEILDVGQFAGGHISGGDTYNKNNEELSPESPIFLDVLKTLESALRQSMEFNFTAFPRFMTRPIISRYGTGMFYNTHTDFPVANFLNTQIASSHRSLAPVGHNYVRTDLSVTLFLSDPSTYDGGELCFDGEGDGQRFKLPAGSAILYPTGVPHSVSKVTRGERVAGIFWVQSMFPVESERRVVHDSYNLVKMIEKSAPSSPEFQQAEINFYSLFRMFARV